ncbi:MAG: patatin-like phospholipase family protein, partial [Candidatus Bipolaricaulota bacterium]
MKKADAVFEGGGVKGLGLVGALTVAEENGYTDWRRVAGTSAGAIVASLLAASYSAEELKKILMDLEYSELLYYTRPRDVLFHPFGFFSRVFFDYGVNESSPIRDWLEDKLRARGVETFSDLKLDNSNGPDEY